MVKIILSIILLFFLCFDQACATKKYSIETFYAAFQPIDLAKHEFCASSVTRNQALQNLEKEIIISENEFKDFGSVLKKPSYYILTRTPDTEEGIVDPEYLQRLFELNNNYWDQLTLLKVRNPSDKSPFEYLEIVDTNTLLMESGCWVYTLKRIK